MWISRLRVNGGFLDGVDLKFTKGLNVIVGARGTGKTTLLELIRHALGVGHPSEGGDKRAQQRIRNVLGNGEVLLDVEGGGTGFHLVVDAEGKGRREELSSSALVLGQNEIEFVASDNDNRLQLLDLRAGVTVTRPDLREAARLTRELHHLCTEIEDCREKLSQRGHLEAEKEKLVAQEAALAGENTPLNAAKRSELQRFEQVILEADQMLSRGTAIDGRLEGLQRQGNRQIADLDQLLVDLQRLPHSDELLENADQAKAHQVEMLEYLSKSRQLTDRLMSQSAAHRGEAQEKAAPLRRELESMEAGLGRVTAELRNISRQLQELDELAEDLAAMEKKIDGLRKERDQKLDDAERASHEIFQRRSATAKEVVDSISKNVVIEVEHYSDFDVFADFLREKLRGSNTRGALINTVAEQVLPRQLLTFVETQDASGLAEAAEITNSQAEKLISNLYSEEALGELSVVELYDSADFQLMDGPQRKTVESLSTGQKCAVTLPIVLSERKRALLLDQPEDHLDNAYLVDNVVTGLRARTTQGVQTIVATHNANIPVLGFAENVVVLSSDGTNGEIQTKGPVDDSDIVKHITKIMEGGKEAFASRSKFYQQYGEAE